MDEIPAQADSSASDLDRLDSKSSVYQKLDPDTRRRLNQAIADRDPATYRALYDRFDLHAAGISFTAFYYYARRIRYHAELLEVAALRPDGRVQPPLALHELVTHRFIGLLLHAELSPRDLERLAVSYRITAQAQPKSQASAETAAWLKVLQGVMSLPQSPPPPAPADPAESPLRSASASVHDSAKLCQGSTRSQDTRQESAVGAESPPPPPESDHVDIPPAADPRSSEVAADEMKKLLLEKIRPTLDAALDERERPEPSAATALRERVVARAGPGQPPHPST